ncbi:hypothetical protein HOY81_02300 [Streptomyces sp. JJ36]|nr:hypothetical protein [Streptomyces sp. JJ36]
MTVVVVTASALVACAGAGDGGGAVQGGSAATAAPPAGGAGEGGEAVADATADVLVLRAGVEDHPVWGADAYVVHYLITNRGDEPADYVVRFAFLDAGGRVLGSTAVTVDRLGPGRTRAGSTAPRERDLAGGRAAAIRDVRVAHAEKS